jgi:hypothetical protein
MRGRLAGLLLLAVGCGTVGCGGNGHVVPLLGAAGIPLTPPVTVPLEVVTQSTSVPDPLPVRDADVAYTEVESALGHAVASATVPWAQRHREHAGGREGWQLFVEMTNGDASYDAGRVIFTMTVRATLRARAGNVYLAQTQASCRQGALVSPERGAPVLYRCMMQVGHQLAGWLDGVDLDAVAPPRSG